MTAAADAAAPGKDSVWAIFLVFLRLGLTSFGGPVAHLGYFRAEFVHRRRWVSERSYADLVALCQFLPGPASSQVGIALGLSRGGYGGALAAWAGFTLPSATVLILFALGMSNHVAALPAGALHGLKVVAVAVVAQAVWGMGRMLCTDLPRLAIMAAAAVIAVLFAGAAAQVAVVATAAIAGLLLLTPEPAQDHDPLPFAVSHRASMLCLMLFFGLLLGLPMLAAVLPSPAVAVAAAFFRSGALVFGGGHVVLPLLQAAVVPPGWVGNDVFLAGYGAVQAVPGPLFTFAAFLGASLRVGPAGWLGGLACLVAIFAPSFLLVTAALPFWLGLRRSMRAQAALAGVNAAVVGLLLAALYQPVWTSAIHRPQDFWMALLALLALMYGKLPPWLVVAGCGGAGWLAGML